MKIIRSVLNGVTWFTQRVTMLIVVPMWVVGVPWLEVWAVNLTGFWAANDALYPDKVLYFWILFAVSRLVLAFAWIGLAWWLTDHGAKAGFFWFKPDESSYSRPEPKDKSGMIIGAIAVCAIVIAVAEIAVRLITGLPAPYLPTK